MKRFVYLLWTMAVALLFSSCGGKETPQPTQEDTLSVSPTSLSFTEEDTSTKLLSVTSNTSWTAAVSDSWIHVSATSGSGNASLSVTADANTADDARNGSISFKAGSLQATVSVAQSGAGRTPIVPSPKAFTSKQSSTTYQLLIYSFADSDGDGIGDFKGIQNKLDYLDGLGATALWLSPAHPASSYHGYDVTDYFDVNPLYGTEEDFKNLIDAAHARGIQIYMDYVLNHSSKFHPWFTEALSQADSPYRDYYFFSENPKADYTYFPMLKGTSYVAGEWKTASSGSPRLCITATDEEPVTGSADWNLWLWADGGSGEALRFVDKGDGNYYMVLDISGKHGLLLRKYMNWDSGSKFGASATTTLQEGESLDLVAEGADIYFTGEGRYRVDLTNASVANLYYMGCFSDWMPDLNYGDVSVAENNACFQEMAASADHWIELGIDGLRLDAVKHICGGLESYNNSNNQILLKKWYERCNETYQAVGHNGNIFMVGEAWDEHKNEKNYYSCLTSCFEFDYGYLVRDILNGSNASSFAATVSQFVSDHAAVRSEGDAITSIFLSNHDQDRFAEGISRHPDKQKQAAAILLTSPGKPFIYQGEELGYYGSKSGGDEYVRTPILWDKAGKDCARKGVNNKVDSNMLKADISVEAQEGDEDAILSVYQSWSRLRNTYPELSYGTMTATGISGNTIASWYMSDGAEKLLVIHNVGSSEKSVSVSDDLSHPVALLGSGYIKEGVLYLGAYSSVVFDL